jgi:hypothetical protein
MSGDRGRAMEVGVITLCNVPPARAGLATPFSKC